MWVAGFLSAGSFMWISLGVCVTSILILIIQFPKTLSMWM